jgi:hypothetical protein
MVSQYSVVSLIGGDKFRKIFLNFNGEMNSVIRHEPSYKQLLINIHKRSDELTKIVNCTRYE